MFRDFQNKSRTCVFFLLTLSISLFYSSLLCFSSLHIVGSLTSKLPLVILFYIVLLFFLHMKSMFLKALKVCRCPTWDACVNSIATEKRGPSGLAAGTVDKISTLDMWEGSVPEMFLSKYWFWFNMLILCSQFELLFWCVCFFWLVWFRFSFDFLILVIVFIGIDLSWLDFCYYVDLLALFWLDLNLFCSYIHDQSVFSTVRVPVCFCQRWRVFQSKISNALLEISIKKHITVLGLWLWLSLFFTVCLIFNFLGFVEHVIVQAFGCGRSWYIALEMDHIP